ncbi:hypothetical protein RJ55_08318 [Drechmeria coniospora]|nr:hypothetical protein RJ55_08318 [Drechmeria coniospora]
MDRIPRLRRKSKPPTIETSILQQGIASSDAEVHPAGAAGPEPSDRPQPSPAKKSPFRNLRIRPTAKRARGISPPTHSASSPVIAAVFHQDGIAPNAALRSTNSAVAEAKAHAQGHAHKPRPEMPSFLALSTQEIDRKFHEITWAERLRVAEAHRNQNIDNYKWGHYQQGDFHQRGSMDRYSNIRPWNHNRVRLKVPENEFDYVNASTISLPSPSNDKLPPLRYIAMQGPTKPSFDYVWRMISEQMPSPAVIIQLTTMLENGLVKCHQYFPHYKEDSTWSLNEDDVWADGWAAQLTFASLEEVEDGAIEIRKLLLKVDGDDETRVIWHFLYRRWPDFGVPNVEDMDSFFYLMKLSREFSAPLGPRIVHCSAGVGRTGTFICLEHLIRELEAGTYERCNSKQPPDPIYDTVESLRQQRRGMVQGDVQYQFLYSVLRRLWRKKYGGPPDAADGDGDDDAASRSGEPAAKRLEVADPFTDKGNDRNEAESNRTAVGSSR